MQRTRQRWRLIYPFLKQHKWQVSISVLSIGASTAASIYFPRALGSFVDSLKEERKNGSCDDDRENRDNIVKPGHNETELQINKMYTSLSVLAGIFGVVGVATFVRTSAMQSVAQDMARKIRYKVYTNLLIHRPMSYFSKSGTSSASLASRLSQDVEFASDFISKNTMTTVRALGEGIGGLSFLYVLSSHLTSTIFFQTWIPIMLGIAFIYSRRMKTVNSNYLEALSSQAKFASERIANMKTVVYPFGKNASEVTKYERDHLQPLLKYGRRLGIANGIFEGLVYTGTHLSILAMVIMGTWSVVDGSSAFTIGDLSALLLYSVYVVQSFSTLSSMYPKFVKFSSTMDRLVELLESENVTKEVHARSGANDLLLLHHQLHPQQQQQQLKPQLTHGTIEFTNVNFSYPERPLTKSLTNFSLKINHGEVVALMGRSGIGKSTLALLLSRFYSVNNGSITIGGYDINQIDPYHLRRNCIALVQQDSIIFHGSILDNIAFSRQSSPTTQKDIDMNLVIKFSKMVQLHDFITNDLSDGYKTILTGERGVQLSGGQKQKLNLCRSLYHYHTSTCGETPCKIYILDECSSALDTHSEQIILQQVIDYLRERQATCLIITHHLNDHLRQFVDRVILWE